MISDDSPEKKAVTVDKNGDTPETTFEIKDLLHKREEKSGLVEKRNDESETFVNKDIFEKKDSKDSYAENGVSDVEDDDGGRCSPVISSCHVSLTNRAPYGNIYPKDVIKYYTSFFYFPLHRTKFLCAVLAFIIGS